MREQQLKGIKNSEGKSKLGALGQGQVCGYVMGRYDHWSKSNDSKDKEAVNLGAGWVML